MITSIMFIIGVVKLCSAGLKLWFNSGNQNQQRNGNTAALKETRVETEPRPNVFSRPFQVCIVTENTDIIIINYY